jgi:hypothetical protein
MKFRHVLQSLGVDGMARRYPKGDISTACLLPGLTDQPDFIRVLTLWLIFLSLLYRFICVLLETSPRRGGWRGYPLLIGFGVAATATRGVAGLAGPVAARIGMIRRTRVAFGCARVSHCKFLSVALPGIGRVR